MPPKRSKASSFPAARIKRIMQQDDDVGKVAGASPLVVSKAVELFLQDMLQHIEKEARQKNTKKVSMHHVKRAVQNTPSLDFLKDLVATIPDPAADDEDAEFGGGAGGEKKPRKRAPKAASGESKNGKAKAVKTEGGASAGGSKGKAKQQNNSQASTGSAPAASTVAPEAQAGPKVSIPISSLLSNRDDDDADYQDEEEDAEVNEPSTAMDTDAGSTNNQAVKAEEPVQAVRANEEDEDYD